MNEALPVISYEEPKIPTPFEDVLETNTPFSEETPQRVLGRAGWLAVRGAAEFMLTLDGMDIPAANKAYIMAAYLEHAEDWVGFVEDGLSDLPTTKRAPGDKHPQAAKLERLIQNVLELWDEEDVDKNDPKTLFGLLDHSGTGVDDTLELGMLVGQDILEMVKALKKRLKEPKHDLSAEEGAGITTEL